MGSGGQVISAHPDGATALLAPADGVVAALAACVRRDAGTVCVRAGALPCLWTGPFSIQGRTDACREVFHSLGLCFLEPA